MLLIWKRNFQVVLREPILLWSIQWETSDEYYCEKATDRDKIPLKIIKLSAKISTTPMEAMNNSLSNRVCLGTPKKEMVLTTKTHLLITDHAVF